MAPYTHSPAPSPKLPSTTGDSIKMTKTQEETSGYQRRATGGLDSTSADAGFRIRLKCGKT